MSGRVWRVAGTLALATAGMALTPVAAPGAADTSGVLGTSAASAASAASGTSGVSAASATSATLGTSAASGAPSGARPDPLSVAVQASGGQDVSYAIEVRNTTDHAVPDAVITQQLPPSLDYVAATPPPHRTGRHLTWTLAIPAHGTARITTTGAAGHHLGARPLAHVAQPGIVHHRHHRLLMTTVCAGEDAGPQACATGRGALRPEALSRWERAALAIGCAGAATALWFAGAGVWRRRRAGALERAGVEG